MSSLPPSPSLDATLAEDGPVVAAVRTAWPDALAVYAFGSRVQGLARPDSDLDLAVLVPGYADPLRLWELAGRLGASAGLVSDIEKKGKVYGR